MKTKISVIISTFNKLDRLMITMFCLGRQNLDKSLFEVIVINDGSSDGTKEFLDNTRFDYNVQIHHQENKGQAFARNKGIEMSKSDVIVFNDDDLITIPEFLNYHLSEHEKDDKCVILGRIYRINVEDFKTVALPIYDNYDSGMQNIRNYVKKDLYLDMVERVFAKQLNNIAWICFTGGNSSIGKENLINARGFDANFYRWGPEDIELGYRIYQNNYVFKYCPQIINYHLDVEKNRNQMLSDTARNLKYLQKKYPGNQEILGYINFTSGGASLEEFSSNMAGKKFEPQSHENLFKFQPFDYINLKSGKL